MLWEPHNAKHVGMINAHDGPVIDMKFSSGRQVARIVIRPIERVKFIAHTTAESYSPCRT